MEIHFKVSNYLIRIIAVPFINLFEIKITLLLGWHPNRPYFFLDKKVTKKSRLTTILLQSTEYVFCHAIQATAFQDCFQWPLHKHTH